MFSGIAARVLGPLLHLPGLDKPKKMWSDLESSDSEPSDFEPVDRRLGLNDVPALTPLITRPGQKRDGTKLRVPSLLNTGGSINTKQFKGFWGRFAKDKHTDDETLGEIFRELAFIENYWLRRGANGEWSRPPFNSDQAFWDWRKCLKEVESTMRLAQRCYLPTLSGLAREMLEASSEDYDSDEGLDHFFPEGDLKALIRDPLCPRELVGAISHLPVWISQAQLQARAKEAGPTTTTLLRCANILLADAVRAARAARLPDAVVAVRASQDILKRVDGLLRDIAHLHHHSRDPTPSRSRAHTSTASPSTHPGLLLLFSFFPAHMRTNRVSGIVSAFLFGDNCFAPPASSICKPKTSSNSSYTHGSMRSAGKNTGEQRELQDGPGKGAQGRVG